MSNRRHCHDIDRSVYRQMSESSALLIPGPGASRDQKSCAASKRELLSISTRKSVIQRSASFKKKFIRPEQTEALEAVYLVGSLRSAPRTQLCRGTPRPGQQSRRVGRSEEISSDEVSEMLYATCQVHLRPELAARAANPYPEEPPRTTPGVHPRDARGAFAPAVHVTFPSPRRQRRQRREACPR